MKTRKTMFGVIPLSIFLLMVVSCKKAELVTQEKNELSQTEIATKIDNWLNKKQSNSSTVNAVKIASLQDNLDYSKAYTEPFRDNEQFVVVPVKAGFKTKVHADQEPVIFLFAILNAKGEVRKTNIVQYIAADEQKVTRLPKNAFTGLFIDRTAKVNGRFYFLNLLDKLIWEIGFTNGKQSSISYKQQRISPTSRVECTAWYWVTTYENGDGSTFEVEEYLYTTCENVTETELDPTPCEVCTGGTESEYNDENDPPSIMTSDQTWTLEDKITKINDVNVPWKITSTDRLIGQKYQYRSAKFTSITHQSSQLIAPANTGTWFQGSVDANLVTPVNGWSYAATSKVDGDLVFVDHRVLPYYSRNKRCTWVSYVLWP